MFLLLQSEPLLPPEVMVLVEPKVPKPETVRPGSRCVEGRRLTVAQVGGEKWLRKWLKE